MLFVGLAYTAPYLSGIEDKESGDMILIFLNCTYSR
jgi:hypothetical protein